MEELRSWDIFQISERLRETDDIVPVDRSEIAKIQRFKEIAILHKYSLQALFCVFEEFLRIVPQFASLAEEFTNLITNEIECMRGSYLRQIVP
jgi:hypothetical protein